MLISNENYLKLMKIANCIERKKQLPKNTVDFLREIANEILSTKSRLDDMKTLLNINKETKDE